MIVRYLDPLERLEYEVIQRREEGHDVRALGDAYERLRANPDSNDRKIAHKLLAELMDKDTPASMGSVAEPNDLDEIRKAAGTDVADTVRRRHSLSEADLQTRLLGGWLGRAAGCLLGKPIERYPRPVIRKMLESNGNWPLRDYWTQVGMPKDLLEQYPWKRRLGFESLRENIECMPEDDDLNYTMLNLHVLETYGYDFSSDDVCTEWVTKMPALQVFTSDRVAYQNILSGLRPPATATFMNPFREWVGGQIRADLWGYVSPGEPQRAAELAWRDARISHTRNGIYGEMFFAALIATAFVESDIRRLIESALAHVPSESRFAQAINIVLDLPVDSMNWEHVVDTIYTNFGHYHWVHTINNAALAAAALLASGGDYERTICNTVMGGWDTDSNGATVGSVLGVIQGADALPEKWISPLNDRVRSCLGGFDNAHFTDLARRTLLVSQRAAKQDATGSADRTDDF